MTLNGVPLAAAVVPSGSPAVTTGRTTGVAAASAGAAGGWVVVSRHWHPGDYLQVTLPMRLAFTAAPDDLAVTAVTYGPVVLSGLYGASYATADATATAAAASSAAATSAASGPPATPPVSGDDGIPPLPVLDTASIRRTTAQPMTFEATADGQRVTMVPVARAQHEHYTVYWQTT